MKRFVSILFLLSSLALWAYDKPSDIPNPRHTDAHAFVSNPDGILSRDEVARITEIASRCEAISKVELVTVVVDDIGYNDAFDFSLALFNHWGIGNRETNSGVLIFLARQSRDIRIVTGGGVEGLLPDADCKYIIENDMIPLLSRDRYGEGLLAGNKAIFETLTTDAAQAELLLGYKAKPVTTEPWSTFAIFCLVFIVFLWVHYSMQPKCPKCRQRDVKKHNETLRAATYAAAGLGMTHYVCNCCGNTWNQSYTISRLVRSSMSGYGGGGSFRGGGGFSSGSFGGGMSFGGGAGGKF